MKEKVQSFVSMRFVLFFLFLPFILKLWTSFYSSGSGGGSRLVACLLILFENDLGKVCVEAGSTSVLVHNFISWDSCNSSIYICCICTYITNLESEMRRLFCLDSIRESKSHAYLRR